MGLTRCDFALTERAGGLLACALIPALFSIGLPPTLWIGGRERLQRHGNRVCRRRLPTHSRRMAAAAGCAASAAPGSRALGPSLGSLPPTSARCRACCAQALLARLRRRTPRPDHRTGRTTPTWRCCAGLCARPRSHARRTVVCAVRNHSTVNGFSMQIEVHTGLRLLYEISWLNARRQSAIANWTTSLGDQGKADLVARIQWSFGRVSPMNSPAHCPSTWVASILC